jgi:hypothetical protein
VQEEEDHQHHQHHGQHQFELHVLHRGADAGGAVAQHLHLEARQRKACSSGSCFLMASTVAITLAPGWRCTFRMMAG